MFVLGRKAIFRPPSPKVQPVEPPGRNVPELLVRLEQKFRWLELERDSFKKQMIAECETRDSIIQRLQAELAEVRKVYDLIGEARSPGEKVAPCTPEAAMGDMHDVIDELMRLRFQRKTGPAVEVRWAEPAPKRAEPPPPGEPSPYPRIVADPNKPFPGDCLLRVSFHYAQTNQILHVLMKPRDHLIDAMKQAWEMIAFPTKWDAQEWEAHDRAGNNIPNLVPVYWYDTNDVVFELVRRAGWGG